MSSIRSSFLSAFTLLAFVPLAGCGGSAPPPKTEEAASTSARPPPDDTGGPVVEQELGSIDPRAVEQTFDRLLDGKLEACHKKGRERLEYLAGEAKVFIRVGKDGRARYTYLDESTIGDRDTERCVLDTLSATDWPKPRGGEAEVRSNFAWSAGSERQPTPWATEKVGAALSDSADVKNAVDKCKAGVSGTFRVTAYVEPGEPEASAPPADVKPDKGKGGKKSAPKKPEAAHHGKATEHGGRFKAIGVTPPGKEGADKVDCLVDAIKPMPLPSPGSYVAKVTFTL